ncbi:MAG: RAMP superfamily CRISPR-associated protein [Bacteroidales bacterium]
MRYSITFFSDWHCGSGLSSGADVDATVIRDLNGLPYMPGKTLKGVLREASQLLVDLGHYDQSTLDACFGSSNEGGHTQGDLFFGSASLDLPSNTPAALKSFLFRKIASTAIDSERGTAMQGSLRKHEVCVPLTLEGEIEGDLSPYVELLTRACAMVKCVGVNRNRGFGRCRINLLEGQL